MVKVGVRHCQSRTLTSLMMVKPATTSKARAAGTCWQRRADDERQLALVVDHVGDRRQDDGIARPGDGRPLLVEPVLPLRRLAAHFGHVRPVVHADGEDAGRVGHGRMATHRGQVVTGCVPGRRRAHALQSVGGPAQGAQPWSTAGPWRGRSGRGSRRRRSGPDAAGHRRGRSWPVAPLLPRCAQCACALKASQCFVACRAEKAPMTSTAPNTMARMPISTTSAVSGAPGCRMQRKPSATAMRPRIR